MERLHFDCPQCNKHIAEVDPAKVFFQCPHCGIRIMVPKDDEDHKAFKLAEGISHEPSPSPPPTAPTPPDETKGPPKFRIRKEPGANT